MAEADDEWDQIPLPLQDWDLDDTSEIIKQLTKLTASDVFKSHSTYQVSVCYAARGSHWKFLKQLAQTGLYITATNSCNKRNIYTDLVNLLQESDFEAIQELLDTNRDLLKARSGNSLITSLLYYSCTPKCLEFVIDRQKEVNECEYADVINGHDWHGFTPLIAAVLAGNLSCVQRLLERGAKVDLPSSLLGIELNRPEIGIDFIEENVSFKENIFFGQSKTALMYAACTENLESIKILLKFKPDLKRVCYKGMNALSYAAIASSLQCLDLLLKTFLEVEGYGKTMVDNKYVNDKSSIVGTKSEFILTLSETSFNFSENTNKTWKQGVQVCQTNNSRFLDTGKCSYRGKGGQLSKDLIRKKLKLPRDKRPDEKTLYEVALPFAVIGGDFQCVELLLNHCVDLNSTNCSSKTALMLAAEGGKVDLVELLLKNWANVNLSFEHNDKETALMLASKNGHLKCVNLLLHSYAKNEIVSSSNETALMYACRNGRVDCLELLLEHKANIEAENEKGQTPLIIAACAGKYECVQKLLQFNARIDKEDVHKMSAPMYVVENCHTKCLEVFLQSLIEKEDLEKLGQVAHNSSTGISESAKTTTHEEMVMETEETIKTITTLAEELLPLAITSGNEKCVELLVPHCMDFGRIKKIGDKSALMLCAERGNLGLVNIMIKHCDNINSGSRATALTCATKAGKYECVKLLLEHGANPDIEIYRGQTAAIIAAKDGNKACLKLLLEHGANPNQISKRGSSAVKSAATKKHSECLELLIKHGANVNQRTDMCTPDEQTNQQICKNFSIIMCAALYENNVKCLKILSDAGGNIDIVNLYSHKTPNGTQWSYTFLECLENLQFLLGEGKLFMGRELSACEEKFRCDLDTRSKFTSVQLLMKHGVFDWKYWCSEGSFEEVLFLAVGAGIFPRKIFHGSDLYSPLQYAFINDKENAVLYMLSNLYFSIDDYKAITSDTAFTTKLMDEIKSPTLSSLLLQLTLQPWSIQTLCLLTISTALSRNGSPKGRNSQVDSLPIPEKFKTVLKFNGSYSRLCIHEWDNIGIDDKILSPLKKLYCAPNELTQCDENCVCRGFGFNSTTGNCCHF